MSGSVGRGFGASVALLVAGCNEMGALWVVSVGDRGASEADTRSWCVRWRLKLRKLGGFVVGETVVFSVLILLGRSSQGGVMGVLTMVQRLLARVLLPADEPEDELLLELSFRSLLNGPLLDTGGLEFCSSGNFAKGDSGAA